MAKGTGYICLWQLGDIGGIIHVCTGDNLVGDDVAFPFEQCSASVQQVLNKKNIQAAVDCPPPTGSLRVDFDFDIFDGEDIAVNVDLQ